MRGATDLASLNVRYVDVSTHAPHARGDLDAVRDAGIWRKTFQPTPLMRGATHGDAALHGRGEVSTHAPHARGDTRRGARPDGQGQFQPTPLMRGATYGIASPEVL